MTRQRHDKSKQRKVLGVELRVEGGLDRTEKPAQSVCDVKTQPRNEQVERRQNNTTKTSRAIS